MSETSFTPKFTTEETISAIEKQYLSQEEKREAMVRLGKDGDAAEVRLSTKQIQLMDDDFTKGKKNLAFWFTDSNGEWKYFKFAMKWATPLRQLLKDAGGEATVRIIRKGSGKEDTEYNFEVA